MQIKLFSGPGRCFALTPPPLPAGAGLFSFPLPWRERAALSLSKGRVRGPTDRLEGRRHDGQHPSLRGRVREEVLSRQRGREM